MHWAKLRCACILSVLVVFTSDAAAQDRETKVRQDRERFQNQERWIYNDLDAGLAESRSSGKPLLVVFRCIPCEACSQFDKQVIEEQGDIAPILDQYVCVRIVKANALDLNQFQFDYDQSFHAILMNADRVIYGRFGTRSARPEEEDMSIAAFRAALERGLQWHADYPASQQQKRFAKKIQPEGFVDVPEQFPELQGKYKKELDYEGNVVRSCIHCHQIRDQQRLVFRNKGEKIPDRILFPYPLPDAIGLRMSADGDGLIEAVQANSFAAQAGLKPQDRIREFGDQPILSTADIQWVLHNAADAAELNVVVQRGTQQNKLRLQLPKGWRQTCDISWRPTTWDLRRMATGGMYLKEASDQQRRALKVADDQLALVAEHVGEYGEHAVAKNAGFRKGDLIVSVDGQKQRMSESQFINYTLSQPVGTEIRCVIRRDGREMSLAFSTQ